MARSELIAAAIVVSIVGIACSNGATGTGATRHTVDPNSCGGYDATDAGRKLHAFLDATATIDENISKTEQAIGATCVEMGRQLGLLDTQLVGDTQHLCAVVTKEVRTSLARALRPHSNLLIKYQAPQCATNPELASRIAADCEGVSEGDVAITCAGTCHGICEGICTGQVGGGGTVGQCDGKCSGKCEGSCNGHASAKASPQCAAPAELAVALDVDCSEPQFHVGTDSDFIIDNVEAKRTMDAISESVPRLLLARARIEPLAAALATWTHAANELASAGKTATASFGQQASCVAAQLHTAVAMTSRLQTSLRLSLAVVADAAAAAGVAEAPAIR